MKDNVTDFIIYEMVLHLFSFETPKFSANHIIICFWDYIAWVINKKRFKDYSFSKINSKEFHLTMVPLFPVKLVKDEMSSIVMWFVWFEISHITLRFSNEMRSNLIYSHCYCLYYNCEMSLYWLCKYIYNGRFKWEKV